MAQLQGWSSLWTKEQASEIQEHHNCLSKAHKNSVHDYFGLQLQEMYEALSLQCRAWVSWTCGQRMLYGWILIALCPLSALENCKEHGALKQLHTGRTHRNFFKGSMMIKCIYESLLHRKYILSMKSDTPPSSKT